MNTVSVNDQLANIAQIVRRCPTITLSRAYLRAYRDFCNQTQWLVVNIPGATIAGTAQYDLGTDPYVEIVAVKAIQASETINGREQKWGVGPSDSSQWDSNFPNGRPHRFTYVTQAQIALNPTPDKVYSLLVSAIVQPKSETVQQIPSAPLAKYSNEIESGALAYLLTIPGQPWSNPVLAENYGRAFRAGIANAKADVQRQHNTGSQRVRPRAFVR